jgi:hypothetical protein
MSRICDKKLRDHLKDNGHSCIESYDSSNVMYCGKEHCLFDRRKELGLSELQLTSPLAGKDLYKRNKYCVNIYSQWQ